MEVIFSKIKINSNRHNMKLEQMYLIRITVICIDVDFVILTDVIVSHPPRLIYTIIGTVYPSYTKMMLNTCFDLKKTKKNQWWRSLHLCGWICLWTLFEDLFHKVDIRQKLIIRLLCIDRHLITNNKIFFLSKKW